MPEHCGENILNNLLALLRVQSDAVSHLEQGFLVRIHQNGKCLCLSLFELFHQVLFIPDSICVSICVHSNPLPVLA